MSAAAAPQQMYSGKTTYSAYGNFVQKAISTKPRMWSFVIMAMVAVIVVLIVLVVMYVNKYGSLWSKSRMSNLSTGSNNPQWQNQMGDAGWGGSMHSTYQPEESRVYAASAEGGHTVATMPQLVQGCATQSHAANAEAHALHNMGVRAGSAKNYSDDNLVDVMNGSV